MYVAYTLYRRKIFYEERVVQITLKDKRIIPNGVIRIPSDIVKRLDLGNNRTLDITVHDGAINLTPLEKQPTDIHELFADRENDNQGDHELNWGEAKGNELPW